MLNPQLNLQLTKAIICNFRRLQEVEIDFEHESTIFVGANNSGKSSACLALTHLLNNDLDALSVYDFPVWSLTRLNQLCQEQINTDIAETSSQITASIPKTFSAEVNKLLPKLIVTLTYDQSQVKHISPRLRANHLFSVPTEGKSSCQVEVALVLTDAQQLLADYQKVRGEILALLQKQLRDDQNPTLAYSIDKFLAGCNLSDYFTLQARALTKQKQAQVEEANKVNLKQLFRVTYISPQRQLTSINDVPGSGNYQILNRNFNARSLSSTSEYYPEAYVHQLMLEQFWTGRFQDAVDPVLRSLSDKVKASPDSPSLTVSGKSNFLTAPKILPVFELGSGVDGHGTAAGASSSHPSPGDLYQLPERNGGSGVQNLYNIFLQVHLATSQWKNQAEDKRPLIHLLILEEPETNMHTSARCSLVQDLYRIAQQDSELSAENHAHATGSVNQSTPKSARLQSSESFSTQMLLTTHSVDIVEQVDYSQIRFFKRCPIKQTEVLGRRSTKGARKGNASAKAAGSNNARTDKNEAVATGLNLATHLASTVINPAKSKTSLSKKSEYARHLLRKNLDLFFCDAVVAVEGPSELLLLPKMFAELRRQLLQAKKTNPNLQVTEGLEEFLHASVGWIMITGRHFQSFKEFYDLLGVPVLCITDVDYSQGKRVGKDKLDSKSRTELNQMSTTSQVLKDLLKKHNYDGEATLANLAQLYRAGNYALTPNMLVTTQTAVDLARTNYFQQQHSKQLGLTQQQLDQQQDFKQELLTNWGFAWECDYREVHDWTSGETQWPVSFESAMVLANVDWFVPDAGTKVKSDEPKQVKKIRTLLEMHLRQGVSSEAKTSASDATTPDPQLIKPFFFELHNKFTSNFKNLFATYLLYSENFSTLKLPNYILAGAAELGRLLKKD